MIGVGGPNIGLATVSTGLRRGIAAFAEDEAGAALRSVAKLKVGGAGSRGAAPAGASIHFVRHKGHLFSRLGSVVSMAVRQLRPKTWRHASFLIRTGCSRLYVSRQIGHSSKIGRSSGHMMSVSFFKNAVQRSRAAL